METTSTPFLGVYLEIRVDWIDEEAIQSGGDFMTIRSPVPSAPGQTSFYEDEDEDVEDIIEGRRLAGRGGPKHSVRTSLGSGGYSMHHGIHAKNQASVAGGLHSGLAPEESMILQELLKKMNVSVPTPASIHIAPEKENQAPSAASMMRTKLPVASNTPNSANKMTDVLKSIFGKSISPDETATTTTDSTTFSATGMATYGMNNDKDISYSDEEEEVYKFFMGFLQ